VQQGDAVGQPVGQPCVVVLLLLHLVPNDLQGVGGWVGTVGW
jgi:hypothetical protein